jgi:iron complex transport system permease protein
MLKTRGTKIAGLILGFCLLIFVMGASLVYGYTDTSWKLVLHSFTGHDGSNEHIIIQTVRLPRTLIAAAVGASLAIAGALMQALTKNPLAEPYIFGVNAGAGFFVVLAVTFLSVSSLQVFTWVAFLGAAIAAFLVYFISSIGREGLTSMKLTLAGAAIAALFSSLTQGFLSINELALDQVLFWLAGSVQGRKLEMLTGVFPYLLVGWIAAMLLAGKINILMMGDDVARGLGLRTGAVKMFTAISIILLAGGSVAVAGPIGFVGLVIPHLSRFLVGIDHRWILPYSAVLGGILLLLADIGARYVVMPEEVPVGVMTAMIGTPFFIYIARKGVHKS